MHRIVGAVEILLSHCKTSFPKLHRRQARQRRSKKSTPFSTGSLRPVRPGFSKTVTKFHSPNPGLHHPNTISSQHSFSVLTCFVKKVYVEGRPKIRREGRTHRPRFAVRQGAHPPTRQKVLKFTSKLIQIHTFPLNVLDFFSNFQFCDSIQKGCEKP